MHVAEKNMYGRKVTGIERTTEKYKAVYDRQ